MRIRILLIIKVMRICDHWSKDPPRLVYTSIVRVRGPPLLHLGASKASEFDFNEDPDPAIYSNADPEPTFQK